MYEDARGDALDQVPRLRLRGSTGVCMQEVSVLCTDAVQRPRYEFINLIFDFTVSFGI